MFAVVVKRPTEEDAVLEWLMKVVEMPMDDLVMEDIGYLSL